MHNLSRVKLCCRNWLSSETDQSPRTKSDKQLTNKFMQPYSEYLTQPPKPTPNPRPSHEPPQGLISDEFPLRNTSFTSAHQYSGEHVFVATFQNYICDAGTQTSLKPFRVSEIRTGFNLQRMLIRLWLLYLSPGPRSISNCQSQSSSHLPLYWQNTRDTRARRALTTISRCLEGTVLPQVGLSYGEPITWILNHLCPKRESWSHFNVCQAISYYCWKSLIRT